MGRNVAADLPDHDLDDIVHDLDELKQRLIDVWHGLGQNIIDDAIDEWANVCLRVFVPEKDILNICFDSVC